MRLGSDTFTVLLPRAQLGATAYALYAEDEDTVIGNEWNVSLTLDDTTLHATDGDMARTVDLASVTEDRIPISALPYTITTPGPYYVTSVLTAVADTDGIIVSTGNVSIDLLGFPLLRGGSYDLAWFTVDSGRTTVGGSYSIDGSVGQFDATGVLSGDQFELTGGFWHRGLAAGATAVELHRLAAAANRITLTHVILVLGLAGLGLRYGFRR